MLRLARIALLSLLCLFVLGLSNGAKTIEVDVNKTEVETGEVFIYKIKIEGMFSEPQLKLPEFKNFSVASQSQSKSYSFADNNLKLIFNLTYSLFAPEAGTFVIEPAIIEDKNTSHKSKSITIKVSGKPLAEKKKILPFIEKGTDI